MSGAKETPRQKMIGMMYLVYTALLAMNVSKDILDAFDTVNAGVQETNITLSQQINQKYASFEQQYALDKEKVGPYFEQAQQVKAAATDLINYIEALKWDLVKKVEEKTFDEAVTEGLLKTADTVKNGRLFYNINTSKIKNRDNYNITTAYLMGTPEGPEGPDGKKNIAYDLAERIRQYRYEVVKAVGFEHVHELGLVTDSVYGTKDYVLNYLETTDESKLKRLPVEGEFYGARIDYAPEAVDAIQKGWEYRNFHHTVLIADVTLLNKIISEIETSELNSYTQLMTNIHAQDYTFDEIGAKVFAESKYVVSGQPYKAEAMVTAWKNSQITAKISLDGGPEKEYASDETGVIPLEFGGGIGSHKYIGFIEMRDPKTNEMTEYPFQGEYTVTPPASVSVSATKMNVVYAGIDNPISVAAGGSGNLSVTATGATLASAGNGIYNLRVQPGANKVTVHVSREGINGNVDFRVKDLPKPTALIRNVGADGKVSKSALLAANRVEAEMKDFDFEGVHYDVTGYTMKYRTKAGTTKEAKVTGPTFNDECKNALNSANVGDMFVFTAIQVKGNDGKTKVLDSQLAVEIK